MIQDEKKGQYRMKQLKKTDSQKKDNCDRCTERGIDVRHVQILRKSSACLMIAFCIVVVACLIKAWHDGEFDSAESLRRYVEGFGVLAPVVLTMIQAVQVVIPVLPGFLGCAAGAVMFGSIGGFICNYVGISAGSVAAFLLARRYGTSIVKGMFSEEKYEKWSGFAAKSRSYTAILFAGMVLPLFPDDFFCYFTGLTRMTVKKFVIIIILGKPWCILAYSIFFAAAS